MKIFCRLLLVLSIFLVTFSGVTWFQASLTFPYYRTDALFDLSGMQIIQVESNYYFRDRTSNARNFLITGYDFPTGWTHGFPYKSSATISAPAGDAALIAADVDSFLYDGNGNPRQIPVISLFQNIDYANRLFCKYEPQILDSNKIEIYKSRISNMILYDNVKTGNDLIACNKLYNVPESSNINLVIEGHSFLPNNTRPFQGILAERIKIYSIYNSAVAGSSVSDCVNRASVVDSKIIDCNNNYIKNLLVLWIGTNEISNNEGTGTICYNALKTYVQNRINTGWDVFVYTCTPSTAGGKSAQFEIERNTFNNLLRTDLSLTSKVYIIDTDLIDQLDDPSNTLYYSDALHPTTLAEYLSVLPLVDKIKLLYRSKITPDVESTIPLSFVATGDGSGVSRIGMTSDEYTLLTLEGNAKFYTDAAGTLNENNIWVLTPNVASSIYVRCTSGSSIFTIEKNNIINVSGFAVATNSPHIGGSITPLTNLTYLSVTVANELSGSITGLTKLTALNLAEGGTVTGNPSNIIGCSYLSVGGNNVEITTVAGLTGLCVMYIDGTILTSSVVNQILADFWLNKDAAKPLSGRIIYITGKFGSGAPTGQGITDKANLQNYRSPNPPGTAALWTVTTR